MPQWTKAQTKAIETRNKTLLVSAAAGSGKTTVLIERIIRSLTDPEKPLDISRMLVVTYTRAAAAELRQRISTALTSALAERPNDKRLFGQLAALGGAHISTIDSFYGDVVHRNASALGIPLNLRISDDLELIKVRRRIMNEVIDQGYAGELSVSAEEFASCADSLSDMRNDARLFEVFYELYEKLLSHPDNIKFLLNCADSYNTLVSDDFFDVKYGKVVQDYVREELEFLIRILNGALDYFSGYEAKVRSAFEDDLAFCTEALGILNGGSYEKTREFWATYSPTRLNSPKGDDKTEEAEYFCELRSKTVKEKIKKLGDSYFGAGFSPYEIKKYAAESAEKCRVLYAILSRFESLYGEEKLNLGVCEFSDVKLWAYKLLVNPNGTPTELALTIADGFDSVYIDEYQDVDGVQDLIFRAVSKPCARFMVGDVKQSIYRFRGAEPTLFMNYRSEFRQIDPESDDLPSEDDCTIFMSENFRCDSSIINFANGICSYLFKTGSLNIEYKDEDDLSFSKRVDDNYVPTKVRVEVIDRKNAEIKHENAEAAYIAHEINRLIHEEKKADGTPITPSDIAVLSRGMPFCLEVAKALDAYGIKHSAGGSSSILDDPEVSLAISLLNVIDNPMRDVHLAATLISPLFNFSADDVIKIKNSNEGTICALFDAVLSYSQNECSLADKCKRFITELNSLRALTHSLSADKVIRRVYDRFSLLTRGDSRDALISLYENARSYEGDTFKGLYSYLKYIQELIDNGKSIGNGSDDAPDGVRLMTMHKSKGLEFPVCFVSGCSRPFNKDDAKDLLLYASKLGIATDLADETGFGRIRTPYRKALSRFILNESAEEEMRVLYVALTRGRERVYVTADPRYGAEREFKIAKTAKLYGKRASILNSENYLSWILTALYGQDEENDNFVVSVIRSEDIPMPPESIDIAALPECQEKEDDRELSEILYKNLNYEYPYLHIANLPAKLSVSKLSPSVLDRSSDTEEADPESVEIKLPSIILPSFMAEEEKPSGAAKGTATHTFMQFANFENVINNGVEAELHRLIDERFMDRSMEKLVNVKQIGAFFRSDLYMSLCKAKKVYREKRFNILLSAKDFTADEEYARLIESEKLLVQGVIDLFFEDENGNLILCDYKTDFLSPEEIADKSLAAKKLSSAHSRQLSYYAAALYEIFGKRPDKVLIYSLPLGDAVEIEV